MNYLVSKVNVIYAGSDADFCSVASKVLSQHGLQMCSLVCQSTQHARDRSESLRITIVDAAEPNWLEIVRESKAFQPRCSVLLTGYAADFVTSELWLAERYGADAIILKPLVDGSELLELIDDTIRRHKLWTNGLTKLGAFEANAEQSQVAVKMLMATLSDREFEVMEKLVAGCAPKAIAKQLNLSSKTIEYHRARILKKMQVESVVELVRKILLNVGDVGRRE